MASSEPISEDDGADSNVPLRVDAVDAASSDDELDNLPEKGDIALPLCVSHSEPPNLSTKLIEGKMEWEYDCYAHDYNLKWTSEPNLNAIKEIAQSHYRISGLPNDDITVTFLAEGAFHKVYTITSTDATGGLHQCIFRCGLPICPWYKLQAEVATMEFVRQNTKTIPVPKVFAFDSSMDNPIGLEWMLMEKVNGRSYKDVEDDLHFDTKVKVYRQAAEWMDELSRLKFDSIGRFYHDWKRPLTDKDSYKVGPLCTNEFNSDLRLDYNVNRGPYHSFESLYHAHLNIHLSEVHDPRHRQRVEAWDKQEEREAAGEKIEEEVTETQHSIESLERIPQLCFILQSILPTALKDKKLGPGSTMLHNFDISKNNILVDDTGNPVALIDWEVAWVTVPNGINRYPPLVNEYAQGEEPPPWDSDEEKDEQRLKEEKDWEELLLKREFDRRLEELDSPHLKTDTGQDPELTALDHFFCMVDSLDMEYLTQNHWVRSMRDKMRKIF